MADNQDISSQFGGTLDAPKGSGKYGHHRKRFWILLIVGIIVTLAVVGFLYYSYILQKSTTQSNSKITSSSTTSTSVSPNIKSVSTGGENSVQYTTYNVDAEASAADAANQAGQ